MCLIGAGSVSRNCRGPKGADRGVKQLGGRARRVDGPVLIATANYRMVPGTGHW